jgi:UDP-glucose 4-epimerase
MKILVTGGAGYIGSACVAELLKGGHQVVVYDNLSTGQVRHVPAEVIFVEGDLLDGERLQKLCEANSFDAVIHSAAKKAVGESEQNPGWYFDNNVVGSQNLLKSVTSTGVRHLIFSSTATVYAPVTDNSLLTEQSPIGPVNVYGNSKLMVETLIKEYARIGKLPQYTILRYFNVAGDAGLDFEESKAENVFPLIAKSIKNEVPFKIFGTDYPTKDGTCVRDYIHLKDLAAAHALALNTTESRVFNLGTETGYSVQDLVDAFSEELGRPLNINLVERRPGDVAVIVAQAAMARRHLSWQPQQTLKSMVSDTLRVYGLGKAI